MCMCGGCEECERAQGYEPDDDPFPAEDKLIRAETERMFREYDEQRAAERAAATTPTTGA